MVFIDIIFIQTFWNAVLSTLLDYIDLKTKGIQTISKFR